MNIKLQIAIIEWVSPHTHITTEKAIKCTNNGCGKEKTSYSNIYTKNVIAINSTVDNNLESFDHLGHENSLSRNINRRSQVKYPCFFIFYFLFFTLLWMDEVYTVYKGG